MNKDTIGKAKQSFVISAMIFITLMMKAVLHGTIRPSVFSVRK